jgi:tripartite-type tricarboxylate transporter receptor subunit TctC
MLSVYLRASMRGLFKSKTVRLLACAVTMFGALAPAAAAQYPERAVTIVVPWPAGGATDLATRRFAVSLGKELGVPLVIENRPGATGMVGSAAAAKASPDGYTLLLASAETHAINPYTYAKLPYDPVRDFTPIAGFAVNPYALVARPDFPAADTKALVEEIRRNPGKFTYSSASLGSASQIVMELFKSAEGLDILHIPYQGEAPAVTALMGSQVDLMVLPVGRAENFRRSGKVKVFAATLGERFPGMPDVPTFKEEGFESIQIANWFALMVPQGTPEAVVRKLEKAIDAAVRQPETATAMGELGLGVFEPLPQPEFAEFVGKERKRWGAIIERAGIRAK